MRFRVGSRVLVAVAMVALAFSVGCGDNGNNNDNTGGGGNPTPTRTATPARTATPTPTHTGGATPTPTVTVTPGASSASVVFNLTASTTIISASADVTYNPAKGSFAGASTTTACSINTGDTFVPNDNDNGTLKLGLNSAAGLTFPAAITCTFDQVAGPIAVSDLTITNKTVGVLDAMGIPVAGDPNSLTIQVTVTQNP